MADSTSNTPQRPLWNTPSVGPVVEHDRTSMIADRLDIRSESNIEGEIVTRRLRIDNGRCGSEAQFCLARGQSSSSAAAEFRSCPAAKKINEAQAEPAKQGAKEAEEAAPGPEVAKEEVLTSAIARRMGAASGGWSKSGR